MLEICKLLSSIWNLIISCVLSLWLSYFDGTTSSLGNYYPTHKLRIVFSEYYAALQMVFSLLINLNGKKSSVLLDSILTHLYATKFLKIWVSENPISSHLGQSEVTSSTLIPNVTRRLYIWFVNSYLHTCWDEEEVIFVQYTHSFFFLQCAFSEMVFSSWYSSYGWHLRSPLKAASVRTWSAIFRAIQIRGTF